jgi:homogentisate solanesyltransferase
MTVYGIVIAATKDLPDVAGDRKGGIETFATRLGTRRVAAAASAVLGLNYVVAAATALLAPAGAFRTLPMLVGHAAAAVYLGLSWRKLEPDSEKSIKTFYGQIWNLFYYEYVLYLFL